MKKTLRQVILVMLGGLLINGYAAAQESEPDHQIGKATHESTRPGLSALHNTHPFNQKVMVVNPENGKEVEVTIVGRPQSTRTDRIIDLSAQAWEELGLAEDNQVRLYLLPSGSAKAAAAREPTPPPADESTPTVQPALIAQSESESELRPRPTPPPRETAPAPIPTTDSASVTRSTPAPIVQSESDSAPRLPSRTASTPRSTSRPVSALCCSTPAPCPVSALCPASRSAPASAPCSVQPCYEPAVQLPPTTLISDVDITPGLPDPRSGKIYYLQVGSFSVPGNAERLTRSLQTAGFIVIQKAYGSWQRVVVPGIPAADVANTIRKLGTLGIRKVWVKDREE